MVCTPPACFKIAFVCVLAVTVVPAQTQQYSHKQLRALTRSAHSSADYRSLYEYFRREALRFQSLAETEEKSLRQEQLHPTSTKSPSAYEQALRMHDYYQQRMQQAEHKAAEYLQRSQDSLGAASQHTPAP